MRPPRQFLSVATAFWLLGTGPAVAQESGITIDPGGPSTKEYAFPLESARSQAAGGPSEVTGASQSAAPLFGVGVTPSRRSGRPAGEGAKRKNERRQQGSVAHPRPTVTRISGTSADARDESAFSPWALASAVLLLGGVSGSIARLRSSSG